MVTIQVPGFPLRQRCVRCGCVYEGREVRHAFSVEHPKRWEPSAQHAGRKAEEPLILKRICNPCRDEARFQRGSTEPFLGKAQESRRRHARTLGFTIAEMIHTYGWGDDAMTHAFSLAWAGTCPYCGQAF